MKHTAAFCLASAAAILSIVTAGCGGSSNFDRILAERDSLIEASRQTQDRLDMINYAVQTLNSAVDSIATQEGILFMPVDGEGKYSKADALDDLEKYEHVLRQQNERIARLRKDLERRPADKKSTDLNTMVSVLQKQLKDKDAMIAQLRTQLQQKDVDIARLRKTVEEQKITIADQGRNIAELGKRINTQEEALKVQDRLLNECYVVIASGEELQRRGLMTRKGTLVADVLKNKSALTKVDIRLAKEFQFDARRPRILSNMPSSSYEFTTNRAGRFTLTITNVPEFWSLSSVLVIQTE